MELAVRAARTAPSTRGMNMFIARMIDQRRRYRRYKKLRSSFPQATARRSMPSSGTCGSSHQARETVCCRSWRTLPTFFEQSAASRTPIRDVVGEDPVEFAETFIQNYPQNLWINRERERLTHTSYASGRWLHEDRHLVGQRRSRVSRSPKPSKRRTTAPAQAHPRCPAAQPQSWCNPVTATSHAVTEVSPTPAMG
jgi:hypothetical protein